MNFKGRSKLFSLAMIAAALAATGTAAAAVSGDPDGTFGDDGRLVTEFTAGSSAQVTDSVLDEDGKLVVVGQDSGNIGVSRFNQDGTPDTSFGGGDGTATVNSPGARTGSEQASAVAIDGLGNILLVGLVNVSSGPTQMDTMVARLLPNGSLDPAFDGPSGTANGVFRLNFDSLENPVDVISNGSSIDLALVVGGGPTAASRVVQLQSNGALDTAGFGSPNGYVDFSYQAGAGSFVNSLALQQDGKIIAAGHPNGTGPYGVARITTSGALDPSFANGGATPGIARPALPATFIDAEVRDVIVDNSGITVAGTIERNTPNFNYDPFISRVNTNGDLVTTFGNTSGYAILTLDQGAGQNEAYTSLMSLDGRLFAGGFAISDGHFVQLAALYTSAGALDTSFASPNGFRTYDFGTAATAVAAPVASTGEAAGDAYLVGQTNDGSPKIAVTAVCLLTPPACPSPDMPVVESVSPTSGANDNNPRVRGNVPPGGASVSAIQIFTNASCTGAPAATGTQAAFESAGIPVPVADNSTSTFYARTTNPNGSSPCSTTSANYTEVTPPAPAPPAQSNKAKKCKKAKKKPGAKKRKCKKKRK